MRLAKIFSYTRNPYSDNSRKLHCTDVLVEEEDDERGADRVVRGLEAAGHEINTILMRPYCYELQPDAPTPDRSW